MFNLFKKNEVKGEKITFKLSGLHCSSCSLNIDDALEDTPGVLTSSTSYAKQESTVSFDPAKVSIDDLKKVITATGYTVL